MSSKYWLISFGILFIIAACQEKSISVSGKNAQMDEELMKRGQAIAQKTFLALSGELQKSMKEGGIENAIQYCNLNALPITAELSKEQNAMIKRTSLKYRNPRNSPNEAEEKILLSFAEQVKSGQDLKPIIVQGDEHAVFYAPIITQEMCLKCHGPKESIDSYQLIQSKYPNDLATGYFAGDLRGMWSIALLAEK